MQRNIFFFFFFQREITFWWFCFKTIRRLCLLYSYHGIPLSVRAVIAKGKSFRMKKKLCALWEEFSPQKKGSIFQAVLGFDGASVFPFLLSCLKKKWFLIRMRHNFEWFLMYISYTRATHIQLRHALLYAMFFERRSSNILHGVFSK